VGQHYEHFLFESASKYSILVRCWFAGDELWGGNKEAAERRKTPEDMPGAGRSGAAGTSGAASTSS